MKRRFVCAVLGGELRDEPFFPERLNEDSYSRTWQVSAMDSDNGQTKAELAQSSYGGCWVYAILFNMADISWIDRMHQGAAMTDEDATGEHSAQSW